MRRFSSMSPPAKPALALFRNRNYLGPRNYARQERGALEAFLRENGYDDQNTKIVNSAVTYR